MRDKKPKPGIELEPMHGLRGGMVGRPVELGCHDDHGDASLVPGIYKRLMDEDHVDLVIGGYGTNSLLPAMPLIIERQRFFVGLMGLGVNNSLAYPNYFAMIPTGPDPNAALTEGFFALPVRIAAERQGSEPALRGRGGHRAMRRFHDLVSSRANARGDIVRPPDQGGHGGRWR